MRVNVTMLARNRHRLTEQATQSLAQHTNLDLLSCLHLLDDASQPPIVPTFHDGSFLSIDRNEVATGGAGIARNQVIHSARACGIPADLLYLSDNDVYFLPRWLDILTELWPFAYALGFRVLGGWSHAYNSQAVGIWPTYSEVAKRTVELRECLAVATQSWLMDWKTWEEFGPFDEAPGVRQSEDVAFCNRVRAKGYKVGYCFPYVVYSTSKHDTFGALVPGHETIWAPEGVIIE